VTVAVALARARAAGLERLDAQLLLAHLLGRERSWLIAHDDAPIGAAQAAAYDVLCRRRLEDEPVAYLVGEREFHGLRLRVTPAVLVPRPETEILVDRALALLRERVTATPRPEVADLGTGSGAIALAVKHGCPTARVTAVDCSAQALAVARANGSRLQLAVEWLAGDWWQPLAGRRFDLVLANPPYIAPGDPHLPALRHEPAQALVAEAGGLGAIERIVGGAGAHLEAGAWLLLEHGFDQAQAVHARLQAAGFVDLCTEPDLAGRPRCSGGRWPGSAAGPGARQANTVDAGPRR
jgi:release factor glutamine methyltransferase